MKQLILGLSIMASSLSLFAADSAPKTTGEAISVATDKFISEESGSVSLYAGIKGWPSGSATLVRVYLSNNTSINYSCAKMNMGGGEMMMCDKQ